jgi:predicted transposase YbfD/YdcC
MYCIAKGSVFPPLSDEERYELLKGGPLSNLAQLLEAVPDPRGRHGLRYDLPFLLCCLIAALLCNCNGSEAVAQWCREHQELLRQVFGPRLFLTPSGSLYRWVLPRLCADSLERVIAAWVQASLHAEPAEAIALDGKALRGVATAEQEAPYLLAFCTHQSHETLLQASIDEKTNEIPVAKALLPSLPLAGRVCTADALHTHAALMNLLHELQADGLFVVKDNEPTLRADLQTYFADPLATYVQTSTTDRHRGRLEVRQIKVSTELNAYLSVRWPYVRQVAELTRTIRRKGKTTQQVVYLITSLSPVQASPSRLLGLTRGHWHIENGLHYVRDVSFGEDRSRLRSGNAPQVMAAVRNLVITLIHRWGSSRIAASRRYFAYHPQQALAFLFSEKGGQQ